MGNQQPLFGNFYPEPESGQSEALRIAKTAEGPAGKAQRTFNRLIARIEKLQALIQARCSELDQDLAFYASHLHPRNERINKLRKEVARLLCPYWAGETKPALGKRQREILAAFLWELLGTIAQDSGDQLEVDLQQLKERLETEQGFGAEAQWVTEERKELEEVLAQAGVDLDLSDIKMGMNPEDLIRKMAEIEEKMQELASREAASAPHFEDPPNPPKKGNMSREEKARQIAELRELSIAKTYKQLVRVLHPDLEQDEALRHRKEALMKELTVAYKNGDLYTMLKIEVDWFRRDGSGAERLGDEKLKLYNQILKEQCEALEEELHTVTWQPRYVMLRPYLSPHFYQRIDRAAVQMKADELISSFKAAIAHLRGPKAIDAVRDLVRGRQQQQKASLNGYPFM